jgi:hypothetical protein
VALTTLSLGLSVGGYFAWMYADWRATRKAGEAKLKAATDTLDASDPDWRPERLFAARNAALPPPEANAAELALKAGTLFPESFHQRFKEPGFLPVLELGTRPHPDDVAAIQDALTTAAGAEALARNLRTARTGGVKVALADPNPIVTPLEHLQKLRVFANLYAARSLVAADAGQIDAALESAADLLDIARAVGDEPFSISQLVRLATGVIAVTHVERSLGLGTAAPATLAKVQSMFLAEAEVPRLVWALRGERATMHQLLDGLDNGSLSMEQMSGVENTTAGEVGIRIVQQHIPAQQAKSIELYSGLIAAAERPHGPARAAAFDLMVEELVRMPKDSEHVFVKLLFPAVNKVDAADARLTGHFRCGAVALACERFRLKTGHFPNGLDELPKDLLASIPDDPFTGKPLIFRTTQTGIVIYSTGMDKQDDGGDLDPIGQPGTDVGFRLLTPEHRRRPHLPKPPPDPPEPPEPKE